MGLDNPIHIIFLVIILLLVFGAKRLPEIGRSLGSGMREFKQSVTGEGQRPALDPGPRQAETQAQAQPQPQQVPVQQAPAPQAPVQQAPTPPAA